MGIWLDLLMSKTFPSKYIDPTDATTSISERQNIDHKVSVVAYYVSYSAFDRNYSLFEQESRQY